MKYKDIPIPHINVYKAADSIKSNLIASGIDTIMLFYKTDNSIDLINKDGTDEHRSAYLIWKKNSQVFIQRFNNYAIYEPNGTSRNTTDLFHTIQFYINNRSQIKSEDIQSIGYYRFNRFENNLFQMAMTDNPLTIIDLKIGDDKYHSNFNGIYMGNYNDYASFYEDIDKKLYTWVLLIEKELKSELKGRRWVPTNMKLLDEETKDLRFIELEHKLLDDFLNKKYSELGKSYLFPKNYRGYVSIIYSAQCGNELVDTPNPKINIPNNGVLILRYEYDITADMSYKYDPQKIKFFVGKISEKNEIKFYDYWKIRKKETVVNGDEVAVFIAKSGRKKISQNGELLKFKSKDLFVGTYNELINLQNQNIIENHNIESSITECLKD